MTDKLFLNGFGNEYQFFAKECIAEIHTPKKIVKFTINLFDAVGKLIWTTVLSNGKRDFKLPTKLLKGNEKYTLQIKGNNLDITRNFFIGLEFKQWQGKWITHPKWNDEKYDSFRHFNLADPVFQKRFQVVKQDVTKAVLHICGLGNFDFQLNRETLDNSYMKPGWTNYDKRVYYHSYDITANLKAENQLDVELHSGTYNWSDLKLFGSYPLRGNTPSGSPKLLAQIEIYYKNNTTTVIATDETWETWTGPYVISDYYHGTGKDLTKKQENKTQAVLISGPKGKLIPKEIADIRVNKVFLPVTTSQLANGRWLVDFGFSIFGTPELVLNNEPQNKKIEIWMGEEMLNGEELDLSSASITRFHTGIRNQPRGLDPQKAGCDIPLAKLQQFDYVIADGKKAVFTNRSAIRTFRYVEVNTSAKPIIKGLQLSNALPKVSTFWCDNKKLQKYWDICHTANTYSLAGGYMDCAREKLPYLGDISTLIDFYTTHLNEAQLVKKMVTWCEDNMTVDGALIDTVIDIGLSNNGIKTAKSAALDWAMGYLSLYDILLRRYGCEEYIITHQAKIKLFIRFWIQQYESTGIKDNWALGDWLSFEDHPQRIKRGRWISKTQKLNARGWFNLFLVYAKRLNKVIKDDELQQEILKSKESFQKDLAVDLSWIQQQKRSPDDFMFDYLAILYYQLAPLADYSSFVKRNFERKAKEYDYTTKLGMFGLYAWFDNASALDLGATTFKMLLNPEPPSYFWNVYKSGLNNMSERFKCPGDKQAAGVQHNLLAVVSDYFVKGLAGYRLLDKAVGSNQFLIKPIFEPNVGQVRFDITTCSGELKVSWKRQKGWIQVKIWVPAAMTGRFVTKAKAQPLQAGWNEIKMRVNEC